MKIGIIGTGYVGLVTGACFAEMGNDVICIDNNKDKVNMINNNIVPFYEPGLEELVKNNKAEGRLQFSDDIKYAVDNSLLLFIAVGTPTGEDGSADLKYVFNVAESIGKNMNGYKIIVNKSTVPIGTAEKVRKIIAHELNKRNVNAEYDIVSNPEFLKEGAAIEDFMRPDRVVIGTDNVRTAEIMKELYSPFTRNGHPIIIMDIKSAEITKYASNCMLASRISFMNEIAKICELTGADVTQVRQGMGTDSRIGMPFLYAGLGYGGSCFPKDVKALIKSFSEFGVDSILLKAVEDINDNQRLLFLEKVFKHYDGNVKDKVFAVWGLSFKPNTDDMREAPAVTIINNLIEKGASIQAFDPQAVKEAKRIFGPDNNKIQYFKNQYDALVNADALLVITEWNSFKKPDFDRIYLGLKEKVVFDGRNQYNPASMRANGFTYYSIGRQ